MSMERDDYRDAKGKKWTIFGAAGKILTCEPLFWNRLHREHDRCYFVRDVAAGYMERLEVVGKEPNLELIASTNLYYGGFDDFDDQFWQESARHQLTHTWSN